MDSGPPTARWVSALSGIPFIKVPQTGYVSHSCRFIIAASCSGLQFLMISMTALVFSYIHRMRTIKGKIGWMALSALASYLLTIFVNGFRILFSNFHSHISGNVRHGMDRCIRLCMGRNGRSIRPSTGPGLEHMAHAKTASYHHRNGCLLYRPVCRLPAGRIRLPEMLCCSRNIPPGKQPGPGRILPHKGPGKMGCPFFLVFLHCFGDTIS